MAERKPLAKPQQDEAGFEVRINEEMLYYEVELWKDGRMVANTTCDPNTAAAELTGRKLRAGYLHEKFTASS